MGATWRARKTWPLRSWRWLGAAPGRSTTIRWCWSSTSSLEGSTAASTPRRGGVLRRGGVGGGDPDPGIGCRHAAPRALGQGGHRDRPPSRRGPAARRRRGRRRLHGVEQVPLGALLSTEEIGITDPSQLDNATIGVTGAPSDEAITRVILEESGVDPAGVDLITIGLRRCPTSSPVRLMPPSGSGLEAVALELRGRSRWSSGRTSMGRPLYPELVLFARGTPSRSATRCWRASGDGARLSARHRRPRRRGDPSHQRHRRSMPPLPGPSSTRCTAPPRAGGGTARSPQRASPAI